MKSKQNAKHTKKLKIKKLKNRKFLVGYGIENYNTRFKHESRNMRKENLRAMLINSERRSKAEKRKKDRKTEREREGGR